MRLIDAGELKERFCEENCGKNRCVDHMDKCAWILSVEESKTAFNVDKVVESLMNRFRIVSNDEDLEWNRAIDYAIKIVKCGGVEWNWIMKAAFLSYKAVDGCGIMMKKLKMKLLISLWNELEDGWNQ